MKPKEILDKCFHGNKNIITPHILGRGSIGDYGAYEFSEGQGMRGNIIYGLTVVLYLPSFDLSDCLINLGKIFDSKERIRREIKRLKKNPEILQWVEAKKGDSWRCRHGVSRWVHRECWLYYMTGRESLKTKILEYDFGKSSMVAFGAGI